jgi:hypothetical protein
MDHSLGFDDPEVVHKVARRLDSLRSNSHWSRANVVKA